MSESKLQGQMGSVVRRDGGFTPPTPAVAAETVEGNALSAGAGEKEGEVTETRAEGQAAEEAPRDDKGRFIGKERQQPVVAEGEVEAGEGEPDEEEPAGGEEPAHEPEPGREGKPRGVRADQRIAQLTRQRHEAERRADFYRKVARGEPVTPAEAQAAGEPWPGPAPAAQRPPAEAQAPAAEADTAAITGDDAKDPQPQRGDYEDPDEYLDARTRWNTRWESRRLARVQAEERKALQSRAERAKEDQDLFALIAAGNTKHADFDEVATRNPELPITLDMRRAMIALGADVGADIAYHLGRAPGEAARIASLDVAAQHREIGLLAGRLAAGTPAGKDEAPPAKPDAPRKVSNAPAPATPAGVRQRAQLRVDQMTQDQLADYLKKNVKGGTRA